MLCCLRLEKHDTNGYDYVDMTGRSEYEDYAAMRATRSALAKAFLSKEISAARTEIRTTNSEAFDVIVVGHKDDLSDIGPVWNVETHMALGMAYETISAWMTVRPTKIGDKKIENADGRALFIIREKDADSFVKGADRLQKFLVDAIKYVQAQELEDVYA